MLTFQDALVKIYNLSKKYIIDNIEFNMIRGKIQKYSHIIEISNSKNDYKKLHIKDIINTRYIANEKIKRNIYGAMSAKVIKKKIINEIINFYSSAIGINNIKKLELCKTPTFHRLAYNIFKNLFTC